MAIIGEHGSTRLGSVTRPDGKLKCSRATKAGSPCGAPAVEGGLCFCHAHPELLSELGRKGGRKNRHHKVERSEIPDISLKIVADVSSLIEETVNQVRRGEMDSRTANTLGYLSVVALKAFDGKLEERLASLEAVVAVRSANLSTFQFVSSRGQ